MGRGHVCCGCPCWSCSVDPPQTRYRRLVATAQNPPQVCLLAPQRHLNISLCSRRADHVARKQALSAGTKHGAFCFLPFKTNGVVMTFAFATQAAPCNGLNYLPGQANRRDKDARAEGSRKVGEVAVFAAGDPTAQRQKPCPQLDPSQRLF